MITICKHQIYPHCAIVEGLPFKHSTTVHRSPRRSENGVSSRQYLQASQTALLPSVTKSQEVSFSVRLLKRLSLSIHECWVCRQELWFSVFVCVCRLKWFASVKWKGLPGWWKQAVCSCPDPQNGWGHRWDFSLVDFSSDLASLCLERHGNLS